MTDRLLDPDAMPAWLAQRAGEFQSPEYVVAGIDADDCAVIALGESIVVISTDFLNASPIAEQLQIGTPEDLGRLLVRANLSDLCGSGADPMAVMVGIMLPRESRETTFRQLMDGVFDETGRWNIPVVGGDTKLGRSRAVLGVGIGSAPNREALFLKRNGRAGDDIWVSGPVGGCAAAVIGMSQLEMSHAWRDWAEAAILHPELPLVKSRAAAATGLVNGGIDVSDGLGADLARLCRASGVGAEVQASAIPLDQQVIQVAERLRVAPAAMALLVGGDMQFLVTAPPVARPALQAAGFHRIGILTPGLDMALRLGDDRTVRWPIEGHRNARRVSFVEEIWHLCRLIAERVDPR